MNKLIIIKCADNPVMSLRSINAADQENLRTWKNRHRTSFFYQEIIIHEQQEEWYHKYLGRQNDYMFIVEEVMRKNTKKQSRPIGCMAFRQEDDNTIDLYNIIRGQESVHVTMKDAMHLMLNYIKSEFPHKRIKCDVLKDNPAVLWYKKCGFAIWEEKEYYIMGIEQADIPMMEVYCSEEE